MSWAEATVGLEDLGTTSEGGGSLWVSAIGPGAGKGLATRAPPGEGLRPAAPGDAPGEGLMPVRPGDTPGEGLRPGERPGEGGTGGGEPKRADWVEGEGGA